MPGKKGNTYVQITLTPFHVRKLKMICARTGLSKSGLLQRLVENYELIGENNQKIQADSEKK